MEKSKKKKKLRIAIEAQRIFRPHKHGMDVVAVELIRELQKLDTYNEYFILTKKDEDVCIKETPNFHIVYLGGASYPIWEQVSLPLWLIRNKPDVVHCTSNTAPILSVVPLVLTLHDVIFLEKSYLTSKNGGSSYQRFGNFYRKLVAPIVARKAKVVFTVSEYQRRCITQLIGVSEQKVRVVYNGVAPHFFSTSTAAMLKEVTACYDLPGRFIFFLGNTEPRKNLDGVLKAYAKLWQRKGDELPMLVVKGIDSSFLSRKMTELSLTGFEHRVKLIGYVKVEHLPTLYQLADMLLFPSFSEGFGIPIVEAMASRTPVVTSNTTSMPEVAGDAAILIDPSSTEELANGIEQLLSNNHLRSVLVDKGYRRAQQFSWQKMAAEVLKGYLTP